MIISICVDSPSVALSTGASIEFPVKESRTILCNTTGLPLARCLVDARRIEGTHSSEVSLLRRIGESRARWIDYGQSWQRTRATRRIFSVKERQRLTSTSRGEPRNPFREVRLIDAHSPFLYVYIEIVLYLYLSLSSFLGPPGPLPTFPFFSVLRRTASIFVCLPRSTATVP